MTRIINKPSAAPTAIGTRKLKSESARHSSAAIERSEELVKDRCIWNKAMPMSQKSYLYHHVIKKSMNPSCSSKSHSASKKGAILKVFYIDKIALQEEM